MRRFAKIKFEKVLSILMVVVFGAVAMSFNGSRLAYFGRHPLNQLTDTETIPATSPVYAQNRWKGQSIWTPVAFAADGSLSFNDFITQMYTRTSLNRKSRHGGPPVLMAAQIANRKWPKAGPICRTGSTWWRGTRMARFSWM